MNQATIDHKNILIEEITHAVYSEEEACDIIARIDDLVHELTQINKQCDEEYRDVIANRNACISSLAGENDGVRVATSAIIAIRDESIKHLQAQVVTRDAFVKRLHGEKVELTSTLAAKNSLIKTLTLENELQRITIKEQQVTLNSRLSLIKNNLAK
jgi:hypothetical protein